MFYVENAYMFRIDVVTYIPPELLIPPKIAVQKMKCGGPHARCTKMVDVQNARINEER